MRTRARHENLSAKKRRIDERDRMSTMLRCVLVHARQNVVAYLALFVAIGGTSYAAIRLPANSVGARQIKQDAVRSSDVKNSSLRAADFRAGELPRGPRGPQGLAGAQGARGESGAAATRLWAIVDDDGTLYRGSGVVSTRRGGPSSGSYLVTFNRDVSQCAAVASTGGHPLGPGSSTGISVGTASAATAGSPFEGVVSVLTKNPAGADADRIFHLAVFC